MRTIEITAYTFNELNEDAKQTALDNFSNDLSIELSHQELENSIEQFHKVFGTKSGYRSWLDLSKGHIDDDILDLSGLRLLKYLINNFWGDLFKPKYYSKWRKGSETENRPQLVKRYSKVQFEANCVLSGVCYDNDILEPIYNFLKNPEPEITFERLLNKCENCFTVVYNSIEEDLNSDEQKAETIQANELEFDEEGNRI